MSDENRQVWRLTVEALRAGPTGVGGQLLAPRRQFHKLLRAVGPREMVRRCDVGGSVCGACTSACLPLRRRKGCVVKIARGTQNLG